MQTNYPKTTISVNNLKECRLAPKTKLRKNVGWAEQREAQHLMIDLKKLFILGDEVWFYKLSIIV